MLSHSELFTKYQNLVKDHNAKFSFHISTTDKVYYKKYPYNLRISSQGSAPSGYYRKIWTAQRESGHTSLFSKTEDDQINLMTSLATHLPSNKKTHYIIEIFAPENQEHLDKLLSYSVKSIGKKSTYVHRETLFKDKFKYKIMFDISYKIRRLPIQERAKTFYDEFTVLYNLYNGEAKSDIHEFSSQIMSIYDRAKDCLETGNMHYSIERYPYSFTMYIKDEDDLVYLNFLGDQYFKINKIEVAVND